tara:strand:+ start:4430 stop:4849 length:420 start_codon:yes stop_codon:yes gene_type:complete
MATNTGTYTGESGVVKFSDDTSAVVAVASVRSFTIDQETQAIESTVMGSSGRSYLAGLTQFSGTMDVFFRDDDDGQNSIFSAVGSNPAAVELYPSGETTGVKLSGSIIITGHSITSNFDGMVEASVTFQGSGALTKTDI